MSTSNIPGFVPTNKLMLTGPPMEHRNDAALGVLMRRFQTASTSTIAGQNAGRFRQMGVRSPQVQQPTRKSFLVAAPQPSTSYGNRRSDYWPDNKRYRKFTGPGKEAEQAEQEVINVSSDSEVKISDSDSDVKII